MYAGNLNEEQKKSLRTRCDSLRYVQDEINLKIDARTIERLKATPVSEVWLEELKRLAQESVYMKGFPYKDEVVSIYNGLSETDKKNGFR